MSANISLVGGKAEAFTSLTPAWWDRDGDYCVDHHLTSEEVWGEQGLLCHEYGLKALYDDKGQEIPGFLRTVRLDTDLTIGVGMKKGYQIVQPRKAFEWMDSLMNDGVMRYASAGVLNGGAQIWVLGLIPNNEEDNPVDDFHKYVLWMDDYTAAKSLLWFPCLTRVVCENTANVAKCERDAAKFRGIRHSGDMDAKLQAARQAIVESEVAFQRYNADCRKLLEVHYTKDQAREYVETLMPVPMADGKQLVDGRAVTIRERKVETIRDGMRHPSNRVDGMSGSFYQLYNAVTYAVDHGGLLRFRGEGDKRSNNRFLSLMTGQGADLKAQAFDLALTMAG